MGKYANPTKGSRASDQNAIIAAKKWAGDGIKLPLLLPPG